MLRGMESMLRRVELLETHQRQTKWMMGGVSLIATISIGLAVYQSNPVSFNTQNAQNAISLEQKSGGAVIADATAMNENDDPNAVLRYTYDEKGRISEELEYNQDEVLIERRAYEYDNEGRVASLSAYGSEGGLIEQTVIEFDERGREIERLEYQAGANAARKWVFTYNESGQRIEAREFRAAPPAGVHSSLSDRSSG